MADNGSWQLAAEVFAAAASEHHAVGIGSVVGRALTQLLSQRCDF